MEVVDSDNSTQSNTAVYTNDNGRDEIASLRRSNCIYRRTRLAFISMWVFVFTVSFFSLFNIEIEIDIGIDSFQVENTHSSVVVVDALESAREEWKKIRQTSDERKEANKKDTGRRFLEPRSLYKPNMFQSSRHLKTVPLRLLSRVEVVFFPSDKVEIDKATGKRNILNKNIFEQIHEVELLVENQPEYNTFCRPSYENGNETLCVPPNSILTYFYPSKDNNGNYRLDGRGSKMLYYDFTLAEVLNQKRTYFYFSDDVDPKTKSASFIKTVFLFVSKNGDDAGKFKEDQKAYKIFIDRYINLFRELNKNPQFDLLHIVYGGSVITQSEIIMTIYNDLKYAIASFVVVFLFTLRHLKSVFLSAFGLVQILTTFPMSLLLFKFIGVGIGSSSNGAIKLGVLHVLSIYIMLGIGVDDIYVLVDAFRQQNPSAGLEKRMIKAWKRAAGAMLITSFTTATAFASNAVTIIPVVQGFVVFMSILVIFNYILVVTAFPVTILYYETHVKNYEKQLCKKLRCCLCCGTKTRNLSNARDNGRDISFNRRTISSEWHGVQLRSLSSSLTDVSSPEESSGELGSTMNFPAADHAGRDEFMGDYANTTLLLDDISLIDTGGSHQYDEPNGVNEVSTQRLSPEVACLSYWVKNATKTKRRAFIVVVAFICVSLICLIVATQLQTAKDIPELFPPNNNIQSYLHSTQEMFNHQTHCDDCSGFYQSNQLCKGVDCKGNGACVLGVCKCNRGWRGSNCEVAASCSTLRCDLRQHEECTDGEMCTCKSGYTRSGVSQKCEIPKTVVTTTNKVPGGGVTPTATTLRPVTTAPTTKGTKSTATTTTLSPIIIIPTTTKQALTSSTKSSSTTMPPSSTTTMPPSSSTAVPPSSSTTVPPSSSTTVPPSSTTIFPGSKGTTSAAATTTQIDPTSTPTTVPNMPTDPPGPSFTSQSPTLLPTTSQNPTTNIPILLTSTTTSTIPPSTKSPKVATTTKTRSKISTTTEPLKPFCTTSICGQYGTCVPTEGCKCDDLFEGAKCNKCTVPGHYFPKCNSSSPPIEKPVNNNRAKVTYVWGLIGIQDGATTSFDEKTIRTTYYDKFDLSNSEAQVIVLGLCDRLRARPDLVQVKSEHCFMSAFKKWVEETKGLEFPITNKDQFTPHLFEFVKSKVGSKFVNDVGFDNPEVPKRVKFAAVSYLTLLRPYESGFIALASYKEFRNLLEDINDGANAYVGKALLVSTLWPRMFTELIAVFGTLFGIVLTSIIALLSIWMFTGTLRGSFLSVVSLLGVLCVILGSFHILDWKLGIIEAISISILLGSAIDYPAHVLEAYVSIRPRQQEQEGFSDGDGMYQIRVDRIRRGIEHIGPSIINASCTTVFSVFSLLFCTIKIFNKVGEILVLSCSISILYSLAPLVAILALKGPAYHARTTASTCKTIALVCIIIGMLLLLYMVVKQLLLSNGNKSDLDIIFGS